jgi:hypothetical protein
LIRFGVAPTRSNRRTDSRLTSILRVAGIAFYL